MLRGATPFLRVVANLTPFLIPIAADDGGIQVEGMAQHNPRQSHPARPHQSFRDSGQLGIRKREKEAPQRIRRGETGQPEQVGP